MKILVIPRNQVQGA